MLKNDINIKSLDEIQIELVKDMDKVNLKYYIFDWDDNILHMSTTINMEKLNSNTNEWEPYAVPTSEFTQARLDTINYRLPLDTNGEEDKDYAFENFRDTGIKGEKAFIEDMIEAIDNKNFGVSAEAFKKCLINGNLFAIVTARGHEPDTIKRGICYFIETQLTPKEKTFMNYNLKKYHDIFGIAKPRHERLEHYLSICEFIGVSSEYFLNSVSNEEIPDGVTFTPSNTELSKKIAVERFCKRCIEYSSRIPNKIGQIEVGFSDDDKGNSNIIRDLFAYRLKKIYPEVEFSIYDTSKNGDESINYDRTII